MVNGGNGWQKIQSFVISGKICECDIHHTAKFSIVICQIVIDIYSRKYSRNFLFINYTIYIFAYIKCIIYAVDVWLVCVTRMCAFVPIQYWSLFWLEMFIIYVRTVGHVNERQKLAQLQLDWMFYLNAR